MKSIDEMIDRLIQHPNVAGLVEFGRDHRPDQFATGDYDLLAILHQLDYEATSIHFRVGAVPVDLNLRTLEYLGQWQTAAAFERAFLDGRIIYDPTGEVQQHLARVRRNAGKAPSQQLTAHNIALIRHWHRHVLDKLRGRTETEPAFCHFLLNANILWLLENYFRVRDLRYAGPGHAFEHLRQHEPGLLAQLEAFHQTTDLETKIALTRQMTAIVLAPVGGMWRDGEIIAFGQNAAEDLQAQGEQLFGQLFG